MTSPEPSDPTQCSGEPGPCPEHGYHAESLKQPDEAAAPSLPADQAVRCERYAGAIQQAYLTASEGDAIGERMADAAMAVADEEIAETLRISDAATNAMRDEDRAENARLRTEADRWREAAQNYMTMHDRLLGENRRLRAEQPAAPSAPADQNLRDRIAGVITEAYLTAPDDAAISDVQADAVLAALKPQLTQLADYEKRVMWGTTCGSCARILDSSIKERERADKAEAEIERLSALLDEYRCMACGGEGGGGTMDPDVWIECQTCRGTGLIGRRADRFREAADEIVAEQQRLDDADPERRAGQSILIATIERGGVHRAAKHLRRMADEAQQVPACGAELVPRTGTRPCVLPVGHGDSHHQDQHTNRWPVEERQAGEGDGCGTVSPDGDYTCVLPTGHDGFHAEKTLESITPNGSRMIWETPIVAYRNPDDGPLYCTSCGHGEDGVEPLISDDLPDGGLCRACGVDVLIPQTGEGR